ncbi:Pisatin demethylase, partial [Zancudomyces culisetae]
MVEGSQILQLLKSIDYQKLVEYFSDRRIIASVLATYIALKVLVAFLFDPLKHIPGPWWARFTNLPFNLKVAQGKIYFALAEYHKKYGPTVRLGPKFVSITTMSDAKQILATYKHPKSMEYEKFGLLPPNLFTTTNEAFNRMRRRQVGPVFTFTGLANMEDQILEDGFISLKRKLESLIGEGDSARI